MSTIKIQFGDRISIGNLGDMVWSVEGDDFTAKLYFGKDPEGLWQQLAKEFNIDRNSYAFDEIVDDMTVIRLGVLAEIIPSDAEIRTKIANEISSELTAALENCACLGSQANRPGPGETTYVQRVHDMIINKITKQ